MNRTVRLCVIWFPLTVIGLAGQSGCFADPQVTNLDSRIASELGHWHAPPEVVDPADNPSTPAKVRLGKLLFWDPMISGGLDVACATCHHPDFGYADGLDLSIGAGGKGLGPQRVANLSTGIPLVGRHAPSVINAGYIGLGDGHGSHVPETAPMFWDSRVMSLESQSLGPPANRTEMIGNAYAEDVALARVRQKLAAIPEYVALFDSAFGGGAAAVTMANFSKAVAAFQRSLVSVNSPFDRYMAGELTALTDQQKEGALLFFGEANCADCHTGPMFANFEPMVHGAADNPRGRYPDVGADAAFKFKTPTLRNIALTAPYTHGGMYPTLMEALRFYNAGVSENPYVDNSELDIHVKPLGLEAVQLDALHAFLHSLTDTTFDRSIPVRVPSGLPPGGAIQ